jgi:hypothetical protein
MVDKDSDSEEDEDDESDGSSDGQGFNKRMLAERLALRSEERYAQQVSKASSTPSSRNSLTLTNGRDSLTLSNGRGSLTLSSAVKVTPADEGDADAQFPVDPCARVLSYDCESQRPQLQELPRSHAENQSQVSNVTAQADCQQKQATSREGAVDSDTAKAGTQQEVAQETSQGLEALWLAARNADASSLTEILQTDVDVNARDPKDKDCTAIHKAAAAGHMGIVKLLLQYRADPRACNAFKDTPVHVAAFKGHAQVWLRAWLHLPVYIYIYICVCVCVCMLQTNMLKQG